MNIVNVNGKQYKVDGTLTIFDGRFFVDGKEITDLSKFEENK